MPTISVIFLVGYELINYHLSLTAPHQTLY